MVLVDTSVWIRFLAGKEPFATTLSDLLSRDQVAGHEMIFGELLIGDRGGRLKLLESYVKIHQAPTVPHGEVLEFVRARKLFGLGVGWIDVHVLASAVVSRMQIWTADPRFAGAAEDLQVAFDAT
jgi:predicted nucleic acid-binding protein